MSPQRKKRKLNDEKPKLVIVCEGKETERPYFEELVRLSPLLSLDDVLIYPIPSENKKNILKGKKSSLKTNNEYYPGVYDKYYEEYNYEPMRWVRATELIFEQQKCIEGWAVYDLDNKPGGRTKEHHQKAYEHIKNKHNLLIALSAYSIEEWFLLHYERNEKNFSDSECKDDNKKVIRCGSQLCVKTNDCNGQRCLGGYLRKQHYMVVSGKEYDKGLGTEYASITKAKLHQACVNAAWSRSLKPDKMPYECNPYSDVDILVMKLLNEKWETLWNIKWPRLGDVFTLDNEKYKIDYSNGEVSIIYEGDNPYAVIGKDNIYWCDGKTTSDYKIIQSACNSANVNFSNCSRAVLDNRPKGKAILCVKDNNQEYYFEINQQ